MDKVDAQGMYKVYDRWPELAREAYESDLEPVNFSDVDHIVFAGMGGSGAIGDLFASVLSKTDTHISIVKGYVLPKTVDKNTLVVCTSVSGNTVETLTVLKSTQKLDCKTLAFSSGGAMESFCIQNDLEYRKIPMIHSPRASFVNFVYSMLYVMNSILPIQKNDVLESIMRLEELSHIISSSNLTYNNSSLNLAQFLDVIPCIYYPYGLHAAVIRFKSSLQENAKMHVFIEDVLEACHNGIVCWEKPSIVKPVFIRGTDDHIKTKERWEIVKQYFNENKIEFREIFSVKGNIFSKIITLIYLLDYCSIYRAILSNTDPSPISSIDYIKSKLG